MTSLLQLQSLWIPFHTFLQDESRVEVDFFWDFNAEGQNNYRGHFWLIPSPKWPPWRARETVFVINDLLPFSRCFKRREWIFSWFLLAMQTLLDERKEQRRKSLSLIALKQKRVAWTSLSAVQNLQSENLSWHNHSLQCWGNCSLLRGLGYVCCTIR